jgi:inorganic pyrophosphatase
MKIKTFFSLILFFCLFPSLSNSDDTFNPCGIAPGLTYLDPYTLVSNKDFWRDFPPYSENGELNVIVEIPTGRTEKWEVRKSDGALVWDFKKGKPRVLKFIGYPGNYGMIPQTLLSEELGGDGDPLDVIVLGPPIPRGSVVQARLIGVLKLLDGGEQDDKLIAVSLNSPFYKIDTLGELDKKFPGISNILENWFVNYRGPGEMESGGFFGLEEAQLILKKASKQFKRSNARLEN